MEDRIIEIGEGEDILRVIRPVGVTDYGDEYYQPYVLIQEYDTRKGEILKEIFVLDKEIEKLIKALREI